MSSKRRCILCARKESRSVPLKAHPDGIGPVCEDPMACRHTQSPLPKPPKPDLGPRNGMTYHEAFVYLRTRVQQLQRIPIGGCTKAERDEETALIIALGAMKDFSGCFHPDEIIDADELPTPREEN
jgi:hypothetical protein